MIIAKRLHLQGKSKNKFFDFLFSFVKGYAFLDSQWCQIPIFIGIKFYKSFIFFFEKFISLFSLFINF